jgi:hypothetical protein
MSNYSLTDYDNDDNNVDNDNNVNNVNNYNNVDNDNNDNEAEGGFHDVASFRAELGVTDMSDYEIQKIVDENRQQAQKSGTNIGEFLAYDLEKQEQKVKQQEREMEKMREEMNKLKVNKSSYDDDDWRKMRNFKNDLDYTKNLFYYTSPSILDDYLKKEKIKREVKEELINEKKQKERDRELAKLWANYDKPKTTRARKSPARKKSPKRKKSASRKKSTKRK